MTIIKISCQFCALALTPFICQSGVHQGQWCVRCMEPHPQHNGKPFWFFWPRDKAPPGLLPPAVQSSTSPPSSQPTEPTPIVVQADGVCSFSGCTKRTPMQASRCENAMCKFHCIEQGGCTTGTQHQPQFASKRQKKRAIDTAAPTPVPTQATGTTASASLTRSVTALPSSTVGCDEDILDDDQFLDDLETARQHSLQDMQASQHRALGMTTSHPAYLPPAYVPPSYIPSSSPPASPSGAYPLHLASISLAAKGKGKGKGSGQPKITTQMNSTWAAEYKFGAVQLSAKAQKDQARLANRLVAERQIDLIYWDRDYGLPYELALQWTDNDQSDLPHWPDFALTHVDILLPTLGNDITAVQWYNPDHRVWKTLARLNYTFRVKKNDQLLFRRKGVVHCAKFDEITQRLPGHTGTGKSSNDSRAFKNLSQERKAVKSPDLSTFSDFDTDSLTASPYHAPDALSLSHKRTRNESSDTVTGPGTKRLNRRRTPSAASSDTSLSQHISSSIHHDNPVPSSPAPLSPITTPLSRPLILPVTRRDSTSLLEPQHVEQAQHRWPNHEYVIDIINGITEMDSEALKHLSRAERFHHVFKRKYIKSTYNDACKRWRLASQELRDKLLAAGRTPEGRWFNLTRTIKLKRSKQPEDDRDTPLIPDIDLTTD